MTITRRAFLATGVAATGLAALAPTAFARGGRRQRSSESYFEWKDLGRGAFMAVGEGGNALLAASAGRAMLVDCKNAPFGETLRREAEAHGTKLTHVFNTHHHADHTGGNSAFARSVPLFAHPNARNRVIQQLDRYKAGITGGMAQIARSQKPAKDAVLEDAKRLAEIVNELTADDFAPTEALSSNESLRIGDLTIVARHFGAGHTDNDVIIHIPELNLIHMGDLLFHGLHPYWDDTAAPSSAGWMESCRRAAAMCNDTTVVIPGHGELTDVSGIRGQIAYFEAVRAAAADAKAKGTTREDFLKIELPIFEGRGFAQVKPRVLGGVYDEIVGGQ